MNEEEALEIFKNLILLPYDWKITDKYKGTINFIGAIEGNEAIEIISNLIEKLQKENEELREKWDKDTHILQNELDLTNADKINNYIPIQKVKDKIEEYKNMLKTCNKVKDIDRIKAINERILELQELLEGRK